MTDMGAIASAAGGPAQPTNFSAMGASGSVGTALRLLSEDLTRLEGQLEVPAPEPGVPGRIARQAAGLLAAVQGFSARVWGRHVPPCDVDLFRGLLDWATARARQAADGVQAAFQSGRWGAWASSDLERAYASLGTLQNTLAGLAQTLVAGQEAPLPIVALTTLGEAEGAVGLLLDLGVGVSLTDQVEWDEQAGEQVVLARALVAQMVRLDAGATRRLEEADFQLGLTRLDCPGGRVGGPSVGVACFVALLLGATETDLAVSLALTSRLIRPGTQGRPQLPVDPDPGWLLDNVFVAPVGLVRQKARGLIESTRRVQDVGVPTADVSDANAGLDDGETWLTSWPQVEEVHRPRVHGLKTLRDAVALALGEEGLRSLLRRLRRGPSPHFVDFSRQTWDGATCPEAALLRAEFRVVDFHFRQNELQDLLDWCGSAGRSELRLYEGPSGVGKTRLLVEACARLERAGWRATFVSSSVRRLRNWPSGALSDIYSGERPTLLVTDYASRFRREVLEEIVVAALESGARTRTVFLERAAGQWWRGLKYHASTAVSDFLGSRSTQVLRVAPLALELESRRESYEIALRCFARRLGVRPSEVWSPALAQEPFRDALPLHADALARLLGATGRTQEDVYAFLLERERMFWAQQLAANGVRLAPELVDLAVAHVFMGNGSSTELNSFEMLERTLAPWRIEPESVRTLASMLHATYPNGVGGLEPIRPDELGRRLVREVTSRFPGSLDD